MSQTRQIHPDEPPLPLGIRIATDGNATQVLGAWIGNKIEDAQPWSPIIDKIKETMNRWARANPTLDVKRLIVQMVIGGMTQFRTKAQGMPRTVTKTLQSITRDFLWNGKSTPPGMSLSMLCETYSCRS